MRNLNIAQIDAARNQREEPRSQTDQRYLQGGRPRHRGSYGQVANLQFQRPKRQTSFVSGGKAQFRLQQSLGCGVCPTLNSTVPQEQASKYRK